MIKNLEFHKKYLISKIGELYNKLKENKVDKAARQEAADHLLDLQKFLNIIEEITDIIEIEMYRKESDVKIQKPCEQTADYKYLVRKLHDERKFFNSYGLFYNNAEFVNQDGSVMYQVNLNDNTIGYDNMMFKIKINYLYNGSPEIILLAKDNYKFKELDKAIKLPDGNYKLDNMYLIPEYNTDHKISSLYINMFH